MISAVIDDGYLPGVWRLRIYDGDRLIDDMAWGDEIPATLQYKGRDPPGREILWFNCNGCDRTIIADIVHDRRAA